MHEMFSFVEKRNMKKILIIFLICFAIASAYSQNQKQYRSMIENNEVPKEVRKEFKIRYPEAFVKMWYITSITYWYEDYGPSYYSNWYQPRTVVVYKFNQPQNYEVEFFNQGDNSRAIYNRYGQWFETRTQLYQLPDEIVAALENSEFSDWKRSEYKERIEAPGMPGSVYRMQVSKKHLSHIIRINDNGKIIQIKSE